MSNEQRYKKIFKACYELLDKYKNGMKAPDWRDIHSYHEGKLDGNDPLAVRMFTACVEELARQYKAGRQP